MYIKKKHRELMLDIAQMLADRLDTLDQEETMKALAFVLLIKMFDQQSDKQITKGKYAMRKFRSTEEGRERSRQIARESAKRVRERKKAL